MAHPTRLPTKIVIPVIGFAEALVSGVRFPSLSNLAIGQTTSIEVAVTNFGEEAFGGATTAAVILSDDGIVDIVDVKLGEVAIADLAPGASTSLLTLAFTVHDCVAPGEY